MAPSGEWKWKVTLPSSYDKLMKNFRKSYETNLGKSWEDKHKNKTKCKQKQRTKYYV